MTFMCGVVVAVVVALVATGKTAHGYDPATTHAGLTERSVLASELHRVLARALARPLGVFEPVVFSQDAVAPREGQAIAARLVALDPSTGYAPGAGRCGVGAGVGGGRIGHRRYACRARPASVLRPEPRIRAVAARWDRGAGPHAGADDRYDRRCACVLHGHRFQPDRTAFHGMAGGARKRRRAAGVLRAAGCRRRGRATRAACERAGACVDGAGRDAGRVAGGGRACARAQRLPPQLPGQRRSEPARPRVGVRTLRRRNLRPHGDSRRRHPGQAPDGDGVHHRRRRARAGGSDAAAVLLRRLAARRRRGGFGNDHRRGHERRACLATLRPSRRASPGATRDRSQALCPDPGPAAAAIRLRARPRPRSLRHGRRRVRRQRAPAASRDRGVRRGPDQSPVPRRDHARDRGRRGYGFGVGRSGAGYARARFASSARTRAACAARSAAWRRPAGR